MQYLEMVKEEIANTIAIDFDGVIHKNSKGFHDGTIYDDPVPGTKEALEFLSQDYNLVIYSCKDDYTRPLVNGKSGARLVWEWLEKHDLDKYIYSVTRMKPRAKFYIDDNAIRFEDWNQTLVDMERL